MVALFTASLAFLVSLVSAPLVARLAAFFGIIDRPGAPRKRHERPVPLWGGLAVYAAFAASVLLVKQWGVFPAVLVDWQSVLGLLLGGAVLLAGGMLDDRYDLRPRLQLIFPVVAVIIVIASGVSIDHVRSPFGGQIDLARWPVELGIFFGLPLRLTLPGDILAFLWLLGITYTTKVLDGLDGLVSGLAVIAAVLIYAVALRPELDQPDVAVLAAAAAGAFAGFLVWNFHPARIFLGESGSTLAGFLIGTLALISGSKVATTLLVLGAPVIDLMLVVIGRLRERRRIAGGDTSHLHFRLLTAGLSEQAAVIALYVTAIAFGLVGLIATTAGKAIAFLALASLIVLFGRWLGRRSKA